jgi:hypothetical protein
MVLLSLKKFGSTKQSSRAGPGALQAGGLK